MHMTSLVFLTFDVDCDGSTVAAHRVSVPLARQFELHGNFHALSTYLFESDHPFAGYSVEACEIMTLCEFLRRHGDVFDSTQDRAEFCGAWCPVGGRWDDEKGRYTGSPGHAYVRVSASWNPWVEDDTIGIPALDSRNDF